MWCTCTKQHINLRGTHPIRRIPWTLVAQPYPIGPRGLCRLLAASLCVWASWCKPDRLNVAGSIWVPFEPARQKIRDLAMSDNVRALWKIMPCSGLRLWLLKPVCSPNFFVGWGLWSKCWLEELFQLLPQLMEAWCQTLHGYCMGDGGSLVLLMSSSAWKTQPWSAGQGDVRYWVALWMVFMDWSNPTLFMAPAGWAKYFDVVGMISFCPANTRPHVASTSSKPNYTWELSTRGRFSQCVGQGQPWCAQGYILLCFHFSFFGFFEFQLQGIVMTNAMP